MKLLTFLRILQVVCCLTLMTDAATVLVIGKRPESLQFTKSQIEQISRTGSKADFVKLVMDFQTSVSAGVGEARDISTRAIVWSSITLLLLVSEWVLVKHRAPINPKSAPASLW